MYINTVIKLVKFLIIFQFYLFQMLIKHKNNVYCYQHHKTGTYLSGKYIFA